MSDDQAYNIFGVVAGAIGILLSIRTYRILNRLPRYQIAYLETLMSETEKSYRLAVADCLIPDDNILKDLHMQLWRYVYAPSYLFSSFSYFWQGSDGI